MTAEVTGAHLDCSQGHPAEFVGYRGKQILTVLSSVDVQRAYYHCAHCESGWVPKDQELDVVGSSFSPGVRRMMGRVGAKQPFEQGRADLQELAGVLVKTKQVERVSVQLGVQFEALCQREQEAILSGKLAPLLPPVPILYIAIDGTGVPVVPRETEGRRGKDATGKAKTREAKIGCVFTQTKQDEEGYPIRDEDSTSYALNESPGQGRTKPTQTVVFFWVATIVAQKLPSRSFVTHVTFFGL